MYNCQCDASVDTLLTRHINTTHLWRIGMFIYKGTKWQRVFNTKECSKLTMLDSSNKVYKCTIDTKEV